MPVGTAGGVLSNLEVKMKVKLRLPEKIKIIGMAIQLHFETGEGIRLTYRALINQIQKKAKEFNQQHPEHERFILKIESEIFSLIEPIILEIKILK